MPIRPEEQLDLFNKPEVKKPKRIFSEKFIEETCGQGGKALTEEPDKPSDTNLVHPRHNRPPYPQGRDGNPIITERK